MTAWQRYRRKPVSAELRPYEPGESVAGISIADVDREAGSPRAGDMIARNPKNHADQWLIAAQYFAEQFEARGVPIKDEGVRTGSVSVEAGDFTICPHGAAFTEYKISLDEVVCRCGARRRYYGPDQHWRHAGEGWRTPAVEAGRRSA